ncbi:hypothetical protein BWI15_12710 [Kribbella sp. ALI-6-A]|uniref:hypothetical protein n=1 Tax=Kribbella sp. ALI-6-A TaxID=1933817 RepID=UPI00097C5B53|nr:hypothetical protein [Kribbella sp. ALI-6-A]ONI74205.1 hypothetical protein BWI15_12710 [Kribbella sp. ALI-6-A]
MTFTDLPKNWRRRPLTDPGLAADVVDLYCSAGDRRRGTLTLFICDERDRFRGAVVIDLCDLAVEPLPKRGVGPQSARPIGRAAGLRPVIKPLQVFPGGALMLALSRSGPATTTAADREWVDAAIRVCRSLGVRLLGFYLASRDAVFPADVTTAVVDLPAAA